MLIGTFQHTTDIKGRVFIPAKLRPDLGTSFIVTRGIGGCLFGMSQEEWTRFSDKFKALPIADSDAQMFVRMLFAWATECELDKQGRILLPSNLREYAKINKDTVILGVGTRIEIWSGEEWENYNTNMEPQYNDMLKKMAELGI